MIDGAGCLRVLGTPWWQAVQAVMGVLERTILHSQPMTPRLIALLGTVVVSWFAYVPIHELLHAFGCWATGGTVTELQIGVPYGGILFAKVFPFVTAGGEYAGRLTGFDTGGSTLVYLATDFAPYVLTVAGAFLLLRSAHATRSPFIAGPGLVLIAAPAMSLTGDFYEMGSILVSSVITLMVPSMPMAQAHALRHDNLFALLGEIPSRFPHHQMAWTGMVIVSLFVGIILAGSTLAASRGFANLLHGGAKPVES